MINFCGTSFGTHFPSKTRSQVPPLVSSTCKLTEHVRYQLGTFGTVLEFLRFDFWKILGDFSTGSDVSEDDISKWIRMWTRFRFYFLENFNFRKNDKKLQAGNGTVNIGSETDNIGSN